MARFRVAFRADGNFEIGLGHLVRSLSLARSLVESCTAEIVFFTRDVKYYQALRGEFRVVALPSDLEEEGFALLLFSYYQKFKPHLIVRDCRDSSAAYMIKMRQLGVPLINFDDLGSGRSYCDLLIDANIDQTQAPTGLATLSGPRYIVLQQEFASLRQADKKAPATIRRTLITLGGSDPAALTLKTVAALDGLAGSFDLVIGQAYNALAVLIPMIEQSSAQITLHQGLPSLAPLLVEADLAIVAAGITLYECFCLGVPSLVLAQKKHQEKIALRFAQDGTIVYVGLADQVTPEAILSCYQNLISDQGLRQKMTKLGLAVTDGLGLSRIVDKLKELLPR